MKLIFTLGLILLSQIVYAEDIYCPEKIQCSETNNINSCSVIDGMPNIWDFNNLFPRGPIIKMDYSFDEAFQNTLSVDQLSSNCIYKAHLDKITSLLIISTLTHNIINADFTESSAWEINQGITICKSKNFMDCPFKVIQS